MMMIKKWFGTIKNNYIDTVDPDNAIVKVAFRTAVACIICILLLQLSGELALSAWGGFAAFAFVQNDIQDSAFNRFWFLIAIILVFTGLTFTGMLLGNYPWRFWATVPVVTFGCAYIACLGFQYFNAGAWALFLYILGGANPVNFMQAGKIGLIFLLCGIISLLICFGVFPIQPQQKALYHCRKILTKVSLLFGQGMSARQIDQLFSQLDKLLESQGSNMALYLKSQNLIGQEAWINLEKLLYQISLMTKSILAWQKRASSHPHYADVHLEDCRQVMAMALQEIINQIRRKQSPHFANIYTQLESYREKITELRRQEIAKAEPDFSECLDYAAYFYHYEKLMGLLEKASQNIAQLQLAGKA